MSQDGPGGPDDTAAESGDDQDDPSDAEVVQAAADAAEDLVFSRIDAGDVEDLDVAVTFEEGVLEVDVYLHAPDALEDQQRVADDAALAARAAVDDLLE
jgi:hypothetical protein